jgi:hypothetical protein
MKISKLLKRILTPFIFYVDDEENSGTVGTENDKRLALYNEIADRNDAARSDEFTEFDDDGNPVESEGEETEEPEVGEESGEEVEEEQEEEPPKPEVKVERKKAPKNKKEPVEDLTNVPPKYKITVNGVEKELSVDELIARAQKVESADDYLREAVNLNNQAKSLVKPATKTEETTDQPEVDDEAALARALQMGSEDEAKAAIRKLRSSGPSKDDLDRTIDERLTFKQAVDWFAGEYKDIVSDPLLSQVAMNQDNILRSQGDKRGYRDRYKAIGDGIRDWLKSKAPVTEEPEAEVKEETVDIPPTRKAKKAAAPSVPKPASTKVTEPVEEETEESASDTIAKMAQARGGPQWLRG